MEDKLKQAAENDSDKVEKGLIKNLVIGYLTSPNNGKGQILKLLSAVLEFTPAEADKTGVNKSQSGWLGGLLNSGGGSAAAENNEGLAQAFVKFLEQESRPVGAETGAALLTMMGGSNSHHTSNHPGGAAASADTKGGSPVPVNPAPTPTLMMSADASMEQSFVPTRNSSFILKDVLSDS